MNDQPNMRNDTARNGLEIAVIGMSGRFPGARNVETFWENLKNGVESISFFANEELIANGVSPNLVNLPNYVKAKGYLEDIEYFDAFFFDYLPRDAEKMDPQVRLFHECVWEAFENAGYVPDDYEGLIGLYAGSSVNLEWMNMIRSRDNDSSNDAFLMNFREYLCPRISYKFNLRGPSININTACSTSLLAVHLACQGLLNGECNMAAAGAVTVSLPNKSGYRYLENMVFSPDGHCRTFDANAGGTIFGNGAAVVVLKTLEDAINNHDMIYAIIKGSAANNDGAQRIGFTAPGVSGQVAVIRAALYMAEVDPETISYVEAHGTATRLGDTIEIEALTQAFGTRKKKFCPIGTVKTNVGHLETASGVTGLIKTALSLKHRIIPPSLHYSAPNPEIDFENTPFYVNTKLTPFRLDQYPLRAGVSSFGIGGSNVHVVLEEAPERPQQVVGRKYQLIVLSAKTPAALEQMTENLAQYFKNTLADPAFSDKRVTLADAAYTLKIGRRAFSHRAMFVCSSMEEAIDILSYRDNEKLPSPPKMLHTFQTGKNEMKAVFMFDGLESQYPDMGRDLYDTETVFRREADLCFGILKPLLGYDIKAILFPPHGQTADPGRMDQVDIAQLSVFILEYALAKLVMSWGVKPVAMIGYSFGEYTAACIAGVMSLEDTLKLIVARGSLIMQTPPGAMLSVPLPVEQLKSLMDDELSLAIDNGASCIVAGSPHAIDRFEKRMKEKSLICISLKAQFAIHSKLMESILSKFLDVVKTIKLNKPHIPYISDVTGTWITAQEAVDPTYWCRQIRQTAQFTAGLNLLSKQEGGIFLEIGPGRDLSVMIGRRMDSDLNQKTVNLLRPQQKKVSDVYYLLSRLGWLWLYGLTPDWKNFYSSEMRNRIPLPGYPFERKLYWPKMNTPDSHIQTSVEEQSQGKKTDIGDWFYIPSWKRSLTPALKTGSVMNHLTWLLFVDDSNIGIQLANRLEQNGHNVIIVKPGIEFCDDGTNGYDVYTINPQKGENYEALLKACEEKGKFPRRIVHGWNVTGAARDDMQELGFYALLHLAAALGNRSQAEMLELTILTDQMQEVTGGDMLYPEKATILGVALTISREYKNIKCRCIDIILPEVNSPDREKLLDRLFSELSVSVKDEIIAYRNNYRWVKIYEPHYLERPIGKIPRLKNDGVYLLTGGLGGIGLVLAKYLVETVKAKLILTSRHKFPPREKWADLLNDPVNNSSFRIKKLQELESLGAEIMLVCADVTNEEQMKEAICLAEERFGKIDGIIHAAGLSGGGLIQGKTRETREIRDTIEPVLAPKVRGTLVLDALLKDKELDFFLLCSSLVSAVPMAGQVTYCAANTFLNHFAYYKAARNNTFTVSIGWDGWQEVGNVVDALKQSAETKKTGIRQDLKILHPLIHQHEIYNSNQAVFISRFSINSLWLLAEHRVMGNAVMPGTGYLELVRAALENDPGYRTVQLSEVFFLSPLVVANEEEKEVRTIFIKQGSGDVYHYTFSIISRLNNGEDRWMEHANGKITILSSGEETARSYNIKEIEAQCSEQESVFDEHEPRWTDRGGIKWGPRWDSPRCIKFGVGCCIGSLELPGAFAAEVLEYKLHPALLDVATSLLLGKDQYKGNFLPFAYKRLKILGNLPAKIYCYVRAKDGENAPSEMQTLKFDITIMDEQGKELVDIEEFMLKKIDIEKANSTITPLSRTFSSFLSASTGKLGTYTMELVKNSMQYTILPGEGIEVFRRILSAEVPPHILVATTNLNTRLEQSRKFVELFEQQLRGKRSGVARHSRPELRSIYAAPRPGIEKRMVEICEDFLGIDKLGIDDDFFELGGDSLIAISFAARIHKELNIKMDISEFFKKPTIRELAEWAEERSGTAEKFSTIEPVEKKEYYGLSSPQKRMFTLQRLRPESGAFNESFAVIIEGKINKNHLEQVFYRLIRRHEPLRTSFRMVNEEPVQQVHENVEFEINYYNAYDLGEGEGISVDINAVNKDIDFIMENFIRSFDLSAAPLMRVGLKKWQENRHILLLDMHHIVTDLFSQAILFNDFLQLFAGNELGEISIHYKDYCQWQNNEYQVELIKKQEAYWLKVFAADVPVLNLPTDYQRPLLQSPDGNTISFFIDKENTDKIRKLTARYEVTLYMMLLALINVLLAKLSGNEDITVGTASVGRDHADLQTMVGMFVNVLCMRNFPSREKSFGEFLMEVKDCVLQAFQNKDYQFENLVEKIGVKRDPSRHPLFDVGLELQGNEWAVAAGENSTMKISDVTMTLYIPKNKISRIDMLIFAKDFRDHLNFDIEYCAGLFKEDTMRNFINFFKTILSTVLEDPEKKIAEINIIPEQEIQKIMDHIQEKNKEMDIQLDLNFD